MISSFFEISIPNISPSSKLLGFISHGLYFNTLTKRSFVASTTNLMPLPDNLSRIFSYISSGSVFGMLPANINVSFFFSLSSFSNSLSIALLLISGPCPFKSVSVSAFIFTLILEFPLSSLTKSVLTPYALLPFRWPLR